MNAYATAKLLGSYAVRLVSSLFLVPNTVQKPHPPPRVLGAPPSREDSVNSQSRVFFLLLLSLALPRLDTINVDYVMNHVYSQITAPQAHSYLFSIHLLINTHALLAWFLVPNT
jgi:hypothetical protein